MISKQARKTRGVLGIALYPAKRKRAWYTPMCFRLIKMAFTFMTFTLFRDVSSDEIYVVNIPMCPISENSVGMPPLRILCGL